MKKVLIVLLLVLGSLCLYAQDSGQWYFSALPGYQFSSGHSRSSFVLSLDGGYYFNDNVGIHFSDTYNQGKYKYSYVIYPYEYTFEGSSSFEIIEVGPEFGAKVGDNGKFYGQINVGYAWDTSNIGDGTYAVYNIDWTWGAAIGYRHFFNDRVAINFQGTYHHLNNWVSSNFTDARVGVSWKF